SATNCRCKARVLRTLPAMESSSVSGCQIGVTRCQARWCAASPTSIGVYRGGTKHLHPRLGKAAQLGQGLQTVASVSQRSWKAVLPGAVVAEAPVRRKQPGQRVAGFGRWRETAAR